MRNHQIKELYGRYVGLMKDWQIKLALARIRVFKLPRAVWDDAMQELALVAEEFRFEPDRAPGVSEETVLCRLMDNRIRMLVRSHAREHVRIERLRRLAHPVEDRHRPEHAAAEADVRRIVASLSPYQQEVCRGLMRGENARQIAARTGRSWSTVRHHMRRIRGIFQERGLDPWSA